MHPQPRKRFGQHFLLDDYIIDKIVSCIAPLEGQTVVEIGGGRGALSRALMQKLATLDVVEVDRDLIPELRASCENLGNLNIHNKDALKFDFSGLIPQEGRLLRIVGNLPYNISTPLMFHLLNSADIIQDMHFLLQKEVVNRLTASPGTRDYGRLSIMVQYRCHAEYLFDVGRDAFQPPPRVESAFVRLTPYKSLPWIAKDETYFGRIVSQVFSHRRKTLKNALHGLLSEQEIIDAGIDPEIRGERLTLKQFTDLANQRARV